MDKTLKSSTGGCYLAYKIKLYVTFLTRSKVVWKICRQ